MAHTPAQQERKLAPAAAVSSRSACRCVVIGVVIALLLDGTALGIGVAIAVLGAIPLVVGIVLTLSAGVQRRDRQNKPWA